MSTLSRIMLILFIALLLCSCASINIPISATSNPVGELIGQSTGIIWFGIFGNVDAGILEACQNGGITEISTVDFEYKYLFIGHRFTCTVTGS